jgi:DNA polymerase III delta prime subunit
MFEHLAAFQPELAANLGEQFTSGRFAQVNLFSGPAYSLRMSFALECVRILDCHEDGRSRCTCPSCAQWRTLSGENLLIVSKRDHRSIIESAIASWERLGTDFSKEALIRSLRILLLAYHPQLNTLAEATALNELVGQLVTSGEEEEAVRARWAKELRQGVRRLLVAAKKSSTITIAQVRSIAEWVSRSAIGSEKRFIIIEAMEETNLSARNALLKLLEEPPSDVYFFLLSEHPNRIMQTILSRARQTRFSPLTDEALARYLQPYYPKKQYSDLSSFYLENGGLDLPVLDEAARRIADSVIARRTLSSVELATLLDGIDKMDGYEQFLHFLLDCLCERQRVGALESARATALVRAVNESYYQGELYNQDVKMMGQGLYYTLLETR